MSVRLPQAASRFGLTVGMRKPCLANACDNAVGSSMPGNFFALMTSNGRVKTSHKTGLLPLKSPSVGLLG